MINSALKMPQSKCRDKNTAFKMPRLKRPYKNSAFTCSDKNYALKGVI